MAESTPELRIRGVIDLSGVRQELASLQSQAGAGVPVAGPAGTFAGEGGRTTAAGIAAPIPISSIATGIVQSPQPAPFGYTASPMQNLTGAFGFRPGANAPTPVAFGPPPAPMPTAAPLTSGTPAESVGATVTASAGGGGSSFLPVGRGLTAMALIHGIAQLGRNEDRYQQNLMAAGGNMGALAKAEVDRRRGVDSAFYGAGWIGRTIREFDPSGSEATTSSIEEQLSGLTRQDKAIRAQEESLASARGLARDVDVAGAAPGLARHLAQIDARTGGRRDVLQRSFGIEKQAENERYQGEMERLRRERTEYGEHHVQVPFTESIYKSFDDREIALGREHVRLGGIIGRRENAQLTQVDSIDAAERQEAKNDAAARSSALGWQTAAFNAIAGGARGRAAGLGQLQADINAQVDAARLRHDENLPQIEARGRAQFAAAQAGAGRDQQLEQFRLQADTQVGKLRTGGHTALAHLLVASAAGGLAVANADPDDQAAAQANANAGFQGAVGDVVRQGAAGIAQWVRRRTAEGNAARRDVFHTAELQAQQNVAELQANRQPVAAGIAGILADTKLAVQALKSDDPEYTKQRDALRGLGVARLRAFQNSLADASQAVEVAPGSIAPGAGQGRVGAGGEDIGKRIADAIKEAMGTGGNASGGGAGNLFQKLERVSDSLDRFISTVLGG